MTIDLYMFVYACSQVLKNDKMPQSICQLCYDKINDFYEYREMCAATNVQTRKLLGLPERQKIEKMEFNNYEESILGVLGDEVKLEEVSPMDNTKGKKKTKKNATKAAAKGRKASDAETVVAGKKLNGPLLTQKAPNKRELLREKSSKQSNR